MSDQENIQNATASFDDSKIKNIIGKINDNIFFNNDIIYGILVEIGGKKLCKIDECNYEHTLKDHITKNLTKIDEDYDVKFIDILFLSYLNNNNNILDDTSEFKYQLKAENGDYYQNIRKYNNNILNILKKSLSKKTLIYQNATYFDIISHDHICCGCNGTLKSTISAPNNINCFSNDLRYSKSVDNLGNCSDACVDCVLKYHVNYQQELFDERTMIEKIKYLLAYCETVRGKKNKVKITLKIYEIIANNILFVKVNKKFYDVIVKKIDELSNDSDYGHLFKQFKYFSKVYDMYVNIPSKVIVKEVDGEFNIEKHY